MSEACKVVKDKEDKGSREIVFWKGSWSDGLPDWVEFLELRTGRTYLSNKLFAYPDCPHWISIQQKIIKYGYFFI